MLIVQLKLYVNSSKNSITNISLGIFIRYYYSREKLYDKTGFEMQSTNIGDIVL